MHIANVISACDRKLRQLVCVRHLSLVPKKCINPEKSMHMRKWILEDATYAVQLELRDCYRS